jgi:hypothetical protein
MHRLTAAYSTWLTRYPWINSKRWRRGSRRHRGGRGFALCAHAISPHFRKYFDVSDAGLTDLEAARPWFKKSLADASSLKPKATRLGG